MVKERHKLEASTDFVCIYPSTSWARLFFKFA